MAAVTGTSTAANEWWTPPQQGKWTVADYLRLPESNNRYELVRGTLIMSPSPNRGHQRAVILLTKLIENHLDQHGCGELFIAPFDVFLAGDVVLQPDLLFISDANRGIVNDARVEGAPDFVVEVVSPASAGYDREEKKLHYMEAGVREYWIIDPRLRRIEVFVRREEPAKFLQVGTFKPGDRVHSEVIEGFAVLVEDVCRL